MENTKAKILLIVVLITLLLVCLGAIVWQCIGAKDVSSGQSNNTQQVGNVNQDSTNKESEVLLEDVKTKYNYVVETAINKSQPRAAWSECGNEYLHIDVVAPKINIDTDNVSRINKQIIDKYSNLSIDTSKGGYNIDVSYTYKHLPSEEMLFVLITERYQSVCATGNVSYETYIYNIDTDRFLTLNEVLELYNITKNDLKEMAYENIDSDMDVDSLVDYKTRVDEIISNGEITVLDIDTDRLKLYLPVDLAGLTIEI